MLLLLLLPLMPVLRIDFFIRMVDGNHFLLRMDILMLVGYIDVS